MTAGVPTEFRTTYFLNTVRAPYRCTIRRDIDDVSPLNFYDLVTF